MVLIFSYTSYKEEPKTFLVNNFSGCISSYLIKSLLYIVYFPLSNFFPLSLLPDKRTLPVRWIIL